MAHITEKIQNGNETFNAGEVIEEQITSLMARMCDIQEITESEQLKGIIESWRTELMFTRTAMRKALNV